MVAEGYDVYAVIDASGTWNQTAQLVSVLRMSQAGVKTTNWVSVSAELQRDWRGATGGELAQLYHDHLIFYGNLMENHRVASAAAG
jgi:nicotinamidase-related amidase